jgi:hypothetical protein
MLQVQALIYFVTTYLHIVQTFLRIWQFIFESRNSPHFIEPKFHYHFALDRHLFLSWTKSVKFSHSILSPLIIMIWNYISMKFLFTTVIKRETFEKQRYVKLNFPFKIFIKISLIACFTKRRLDIHVIAFHTINFPRQIIYQSRPKRVAVACDCPSQFPMA